MGVAALLLSFLSLFAATRVGHAEQQAELPHQPWIPKPGVCSDACYERATCNEEVGGRCDCPKHLAGIDCSRPAVASRMSVFAQSSKAEARAPMPCLNNCTGRGQCVWGSCVCRKGHFGSDCAMSLDAATGRPVLLAGGGYTPRERRPRIYVYDIPHKYSSWYNVMKMDRGLAWVLWERLLGSGALVADGEEADWFYIPVKLRSTSDGYRLLEAIDYIRQTWPWFDRLQGHRHFVLHTGDTGRGEVTGNVRNATANVTWLHHWGLTEDYKTSGWKKAHRPGKDIVVPIFFGTRQGTMLVPVSGLHPRAPRLPRNNTLLFAGRICGDHSEPDPLKPWPHCATTRSDGYSQGVRQMVHYHHHNRTGYKIVTHDKDYPLDLHNYKWCLAPSGGGHGHRQALVAVMGCLPLVISDSVLQPFEPEMDWDRFGLRVAHADIPALHGILEGLGGEALQARRDALYCAAQHLVFSSSSGAFMQEDGRWDAFEFLLEILRMQQHYPGLDPARYAQTDERFRSFLHCGEADMAAYGRKLRQAHAAKYPVLPVGGPATAEAEAEAAGEGKEGAAPGGEARNGSLSWEALYAGGNGWDPVLIAYREAEEAEAEAERVQGNGGREGKGDGQAAERLPLCSMSNWDRKELRCEAIGFRARVKHGFAPGGAACVEHDKDLGHCPRIWP